MLEQLLDWARLRWDGSSILVMTTVVSWAWVVSKRSLANAKGGARIRATRDSQGDLRRAEISRTT